MHFSRVDSSAVSTEAYNPDTMQAEFVSLFLFVCFKLLQEFVHILRAKASLENRYDFFHK